MDRLSIISGALFLTADVFAVASLAMPRWIVSDIGRVILFCQAAVIFPIGFDMEQIGGEAYQLPNNYQVGISYIFFVLALWITVVSELFASKVCLPHF